MKILLIQTAFIGDVILLTSLIESLHARFPKAKIWVLVRKGNESLLKNHPLLQNVLVWNKQDGKLKNLCGIIKKIRRVDFDEVINCHRFASSGIVTALSGGHHKSGFKKNPLSVFFQHKAGHRIGDGTHETERNFTLVSHLGVEQLLPPRLYPSESDFEKVKSFKTVPYVCIAPTSVWFTKQFPPEKWSEIILVLTQKYTVYLLGAPADAAACEAIMQQATSDRVVNLAGQLALLQTAALMRDATMNYVNDSAPLHLASAMKAPTTAVFCSTIPAFGFGPLSPGAKVVETTENLPCRPCGLHGHNACPETHFKCAYSIDKEQLLAGMDE